VGGPKYSFPDTALRSSHLKRPQIDGLIYLEYSRNDTHKDKVVWANGKPVITELNSATRNPHATAGPTPW
jgi:hypothetical protein